MDVYRGIKGVTDEGPDVGLELGCGSSGRAEDSIKGVTG